MNKNILYSLPVLVIITLVSEPSGAENYGQIVKLRNVTQYYQGQEIAMGSELVTGPDQMLAIKTTADDLIVVGANSRIRIRTPNLVRQLLGRIYYLFRPRQTERPMVEIVTATIGVRGTNFLVTTTDDESPDLISLDQGLLDIASPDDQPFKVHTHASLDEFEQFRLETEQEIEQIDEEFQEFKRQINEEFIEFKMSVLLDPDHTIQIVGHDLVTVRLPEDQRFQLERFKAFITEFE